jgi:XTP/dITP diphosphohydrolase
MELIFATGNKHKLAEAEFILGASLPQLKLLPHEGPEPVENGISFLENAAIKARVEVMGGTPGIFSAIWAGGRDDVVNRQLLLDQLKDISSEHRTASFVCTIALVEESGETFFTGVWPGSIALRASGDGGFGYDPVFTPDGFEVTAAQLEPEVKSSLSHRAMAMNQMASFLATR